MMQQTGLLGGIVGRHTNQPLGDEAGVATDRVPLHFGGGDLTCGGIDRDLQLRPAEEAGKFRDDRIDVVLPDPPFRTEMGFRERAQRFGRHADDVDPLQPAAELAGQAAGQPSFVVHGRDYRLGAREFADVWNQFGHSGDFRKGQD